MFDEPIGPGRPPTAVVDAAMPDGGVRTACATLAAETDGTVVLNTNIERALPRLLTDVGAYYLLGYISTNQKLDGRYRRLTVRVKRPGVDGAGASRLSGADRRRGLGGHAADRRGRDRRARCARRCRDCRADARRRRCTCRRPAAPATCR